MKEVLELIRDKVKEAANGSTLRILYEKNYGPIGNIYDVLNELVSEGFVIKLDKDYKITENGIDILSGKKEKKEISPIRFEDTEVKRFEEFSKKRDPVETLPRMLNPGLMGLEKERLGCLLVMVSENDKEGDNNRLHILYEGPPGCGKTAIISWASQKLWGFCADSDSTRAALKGTVSGFQCKPGLLHDADGSTLFIDEIDKATPENQSALLGALSSGMIVINMDKVRNQKFEAKVRCIAACNNRQPLKSELLDRFDVKYSIKKLDKEEKLRFIRRKLNDWNREKNGVAEEDSEFLKKYLEYARTLNIDLPENRETIINILVQEMETGRLQGKDARRIETSIRLSLAVARLRLHRIVLEEDVKKALEVLG